MSYKPPRQIHKLGEYLSAMFRIYLKTPADGIGKYQWTLRTLRHFFKLIGQDVFEQNYRYGLTFYVITLIWITYAIGYASTVFDSKHYDFTLRFSCVALFIGGIQVGIILPTVNGNVYLVI